MTDQPLDAAPVVEAVDADAAGQTAPEPTLAENLYPDDQAATKQDEAGEASDTVGGEEGADTIEGTGGDNQQPALDPPHSWKAEDRAEWDALPKKQQETILRRETERDAYVRTKAAEAQQARAAVEREAQQAVMQVAQAHAQQLEALMPPLPDRPDPRLLQTGQQEHIALFYQQEAEFRFAVDQRQQLHQQAEQARHQAAQIEQHQTAAQRQQDEAVLSEKLGTDWTDPAKRANLLQSLEPIGAALGYSAELMANANATDILALRTASEKFAKADKWDAYQKAKMANVRTHIPPKMMQPGVSGAAARANAAPKTVAQTLYPND